MLCDCARYGSSERTAVVPHWDRHKEVDITVAAAPEAAFAFLDDQLAVGRHMSGGSAMMMGGRMSYELDGQLGRAVGSVIRMTGSMLGVRLAVQEVVTERVSPVRKVWATVGPQRMIVMSSYRMGFDISSSWRGAQVRMFIDFCLPRRGLPRLLGWLTGDYYARWCLLQMGNALQSRFSESPAAGSS